MVAKFISVQSIGKRFYTGHSLSSEPQQPGTSLVNMIKNPVTRLASTMRNQLPVYASDHIWALKDISFNVDQGEVVGLVGRNGAGKSTLLKIISQITEPTEGKISGRGRVASLLEVGTGFHQELTGRENIYLNGAILGMRRDEIDRRLDEIIDFASIHPNFIDTPIKRYSSGMRVRLGFAVAAHLETDILLVDEVLAVGDLEFQKKCLGKMDELTSEEGRIILFVSHNIAAVTRLCSRIVWLDKGKLVMDGPTNEVIGAYTNMNVSGNIAKWDDLDTAPGSDEVKLTSVEVIDDQGTSTRSLDLEGSAQIRVGYYVLQAVPNFRCIIAVYTQGVCAFAAVEPEERDHTELGNYYATITLPDNILAENTYSINVRLMTSSGTKHSYVKEDDILSFQAIDYGRGSSARGNYGHNLTDVMRPKVDWHIEKP